MHNKAQLAVMISALALSPLALADCYRDSYSTATCTTSSGTTWRGSADSHGNQTWKSNTGSTIRGRTDSHGTTTYRTDSGNTIHCRNDPHGRSYCR